MNTLSLLEMLMQADNDQAQKVIDDFLRGAVRYSFLEAMFEEVEWLCGPRHSRGEKGDCARAGTAPGTLFFETHSEDIVRPRVRHRNDDGTTEEVRLATYEAGRTGNSLREMVLRAFTAGVSGRKMNDVVDSKRRSSKSEVSRLWQQKATECIEAVRGRSLKEHRYVVLMLDGVHLSKDLTAVVALGVTLQGEKHLLDFEIGNTENGMVCCALTDRLVQRGLSFAARRPFVALDGAHALRQAVLKHWPDAAIQTCLVHVQSQVKARLSKRHQAELDRLFNLLRKAADLEAAAEALTSLVVFVGARSAEGLKSLGKAGGEMLTLFRLGVPDTLNRSLLSTNSIENSIRNMRSLLGRVNRWRAETDMASKWMACAMLGAEKGFNRMSGYRDLPQLAAGLDKPVSEDDEVRYAALVASCFAAGQKEKAA